MDEGGRERPAAAAGGAGAAAPRFRRALVLTVMLYALWAVAHNLNDILITQFKKAFELSDLQASLVQSCYYITYLVTPIPIALFLERFGYKAGIVVGLTVYAFGCFLFWPAANSATYGAFLGALFVIACGVTFIETAGTGVVVVLGPPQTAEWRINLAQAFNPIGAISGVLIGRQFIFSGHEPSARERAAMSPAAEAAFRAAEAQAVQRPYLAIGLFLLAVAALVLVTRFPRGATEARAGSPIEGLGIVLRARFLRWGVVAQFFYCGAQIGVWSFLIRYAIQRVPGTSERTAALYLTLSLALFLAGRFATLLLLRRFSSAQVCTVAAAVAALLTLAGVFAPGAVGLAALVAVSFCMAPMFPGIYAIGLQGNEAWSKPATALMIMSITGGAVLTAAMGAISDRSSIAYAYLVSFACFGVIFTYCLAAVRAGRTGAARLAAAH